MERNGGWCFGSWRCWGGQRDECFGVIGGGAEWGVRAVGFSTALLGKCEVLIQDGGQCTDGRWRENSRGGQRERRFFRRTAWYGAAAFCRAFAVFGEGWGSVAGADGAVWKGGALGAIPGDILLGRMGWRAEVWKPEGLGFPANWGKSRKGRGKTGGFCCFFPLTRGMGRVKMRIQIETCEQDAVLSSASVQRGMSPAESIPGKESSDTTCEGAANCDDWPSLPGCKVTAGSPAVIWVEPWSIASSLLGWGVFVFRRKI